MLQSPTTVELCIMAPSTLTRDEYSSNPWLELGGCVRQAPGVVGTRLIVSIAMVESHPRRKLFTSCFAKRLLVQARLI